MSRRVKLYVNWETSCETCGHVESGIRMMNGAETEALAAELRLFDLGQNAKALYGLLTMEEHPNPDPLDDDEDPPWRHDGD